MKTGRKIGRGLLVGILIGLMVWMQAAPAAALSVADEEELGRKYKAVMFRYLDFLTDPVLRTYLDRVGRSLAVHYAKLAYKPEFHLWDDDQLNAFAAPAGMIVISRGLLEKFDNVDELAGVLAHELAHSAERHLADSMEKASKMQWAAPGRIHRRGPGGRDHGQRRGHHRDHGRNRGRLPSRWPCPIPVSTSGRPTRWASG